MTHLLTGNATVRSDGDEGAVRGAARRDASWMAEVGAECPLAVLTPVVGMRSETFIRRHADELLPGRTAVIATRQPAPGEGCWGVRGPKLVMGEDKPTWLRHTADRVLRKCGLRKPGSGMEKARRFLKRHGVQAALAEYLDFAVPWMRVVRDSGARFYAHAHGYDISQNLRVHHWREAYRTLRDADGVITMNSVSRRRLIELGLDATKVHVVPYGVDVRDTLSPREVHDTVRCLAVGRMTAKKAPILTLAAFKHAAEHCSELHLDYIGTGPLMAAARHFVQAYHLADRVTLHGGQPPTVIPRFLAAADILIQHSVVDDETGDEEGLPVAVLEGMAHGLPVVSTRHAGIPEAVIEGETGLLVDEGDSDGMAECIVRLTRDVALRQRFGHAGWQRAGKSFSAAVERDRLLDIMGLGELRQSPSGSERAY